MKSIDKFVLVLVASLALLLAGCGGGSSTPPTPPDPQPTAYEMALDAINAATTPEDAQAAYDAVKDDVTAAEGDRLQMAVDNRQAALAMMGRADAQKMALMDAAGMVDTSDLSTQEAVDAARAAIAGLRQAIADAVDVADTSMYQSMLDAAIAAVDEAQGGIDTATRRTNQMAELSGASMTLQAALAALSGSTPTQTQLDAANNAVTALNAAIAAGEDLTAEEKAPYEREATNAAAPINTAQTAFDDAEAEAQRIAAEEARKAAEEAAAAMAVTATKLYAGIGAAPLTAGHTVTVNATSGAWSVDPNDVAPANLANQALTADEDTMVAANHGWEGTRHTASGEGVDGTYEAVIYSHPDDPTVTEGAAFNDSANGGYTLSTDAATMGELTTLDAASGGAGVGRVASPSFDQSAGEKTFELGDNMMRVVIAGSYHGVPGTYYCTPAASDACGATVADMGFTLGGGTWTFKPTNPAMKLMDTSADDTEYASYGWWLHKSEDGDTYTASAFAVYRGTAPTVDIAALRGSATYTGGAAGKYALRSSTGGTNDAGHFTADVTLEAEFGAAHKISGTVDNFTGGDGESRDWSVALGDSVVSGGGVIAGDPDDGTDTGPQMTTWTIGDVAGDAAGQWSGNLHEEGDDGVPAIATGTFSSTFGDSGNDGRMVGAFGVNVDD